VRGGYGYTGTCNCGAHDDAESCAELERAVREYIKWRDIVFGRTTLTGQETDAFTHMIQALDTLRARQGENDEAT
jgi:hypothetical protein